MVTCPNCKQLVEEGKFCENCGAALTSVASSETNSAPISNQNSNVCPRCGAPFTGGKFCEKCGSPLPNANGVTNNQNTQQSVSNIFNKLGNSINTFASDAMAVKSDFSNNVVLCMTNKIPQGQDKKIKVDDTEVVFFNSGSGFSKYTQSFFTQSNSFVCFYVRNNTVISNNFKVEFESLIKKLNDTDKIKISVNYYLELIVDDIELFFNSLISMRQDSWKVVDVNAMLSENLRKIVSENTINMLQQDGNIDLRNPSEQINKFNQEISILINDAVKQIGLKVSSFSLRNVDIDIKAINNILIKNLYKESMEG